MPAAIVFEDADPAAAASFIARRAFINGGQYCTTLKKAYIHRSFYENVRKDILDRVQRLTVGDAFDPKTDIGPIRVERTRNILQNALEKCRPAGLVTGSITGETVFPLVLETEATAIPDLELFGPFLLLKPFDDPDEAAMELVQTRYGFLLSFFGSVSEKITALFYSHFGMVHDNPDFTFTPLRLPFGGKKASGWILERSWQHKLSNNAMSKIRSVISYLSVNSSYIKKTPDSSGLEPWLNPAGFGKPGGKVTGNICRSLVECGSGAPGILRGRRYPGRKLFRCSYRFCRSSCRITDTGISAI